MCDVMVGVVGFLVWMLHGFIFFKINRFYPDHTPETEAGSVIVTTQSSETEGSPTRNREITVVSQPEKPSALGGPPSRNDPENTKLHHSAATDNRIEDYVEMLEEEHKEMRKEIYHFQQKFQQLSFIITGLEEMQYQYEELKQEAVSMRTNISEQEQHRQLIEIQLRNEITDLQRNLEAAENESKNLLHKLSVFEQTGNQILEPNLESANEVFQSTAVGISQLQNELPDAPKNHHGISKSSTLVSNGTKERASTLRSTAMKWQMDCQSNESRLRKENADLTKKLSTLQDEYQNDLALKTAELHRVSEDNRSLAVTLNLAIETLSAKLYAMDDLKAELQDLKTKQQEESSVHEENEDLKEQVASLKETELKLMDEKENLKAKLSSLYSKERSVIRAKEAAEQAAEEEKSKVEKHLSTIAWLKSDLELANTTNKTLKNDQLRDELAKFKALNAVLEKENKEIRIDMERLNESVRKRKSDWRLSELKLSESNEDFKRKLGRLQTENQRLLETNSLVKTDLETANKEMKNLREALAVKEYETIELSKELETLRTETEMTMESCKATSFSDQQTGELVKEHCDCNELSETQIDLGISGCCVRRPSSPSESNVDVNNQPCAQIQELLKTKIEVLEAENKNLTSSIAVMQQAEEDSQATVKDLMMKYRLAMEKNEAVFQAIRQAEQAAEEQADALAEALTASREDAAEASCYVLVENIAEIGSTDLTQKDAGFTEKKTVMSSFKRWLNRCDFQKPKVSQGSGLINLMQSTEKSLSRKAKNLLKRH